MRERFVGPWGRSLGLLAGAWLLGACGASEQGSGTPAEGAQGGGGFWTRGEAAPPSQPKVLRQGLVSGVDFELTRVSAPSVVAPYTLFYVDVTACNRGDTFATADVTVFLSADGTITPEDVPVAGGSVNLGPDSCAALRVPAALSGNDGPWVLGAIVDPQQRVAEVSEYNNVQAGGPLFVGYIPDLVVSQVTGPASAPPYGSFPVTVRACNVGTTWSQGGSVRVFLSEDATITLTDLPVGDVYLPGLGAGECFSQQVSAFAPEEGTRYLGALVDPEGYVPEFDDGNNALTGNQVVVGYGPDLVVRGLSAPTNVRPYEPFTTTVEVCNQGTVPASSFSLTVVRSPDDVIDVSDAPVGQQSSHDVLVPGECRQVSVPSSISESGGVSVLGALVDMGGAPPELRADNNTFVGPLIGVGDGPDLVVTSVVGPPNLPPSSTYYGPAVVTVCNQGTQPASYVSVDLYQSADSTITPGDIPVGRAYLPPLSVGACASANVGVQLTGSQGPAGPGSTWYLGAIADRDGLLPELREDNNAFEGQRFGMGYLPDYVVRAVTGPTTASPGGPATVSVTVCNEGTEVPYNNLPVSVVLSTDADISAADVQLTQQMVPTLQPRECVSLRLPVPLPGGSYGPYYGLGPTAYLGAIVDPAGVSPEFFKDNNALAGSRIPVASGPDLVVRAVSAPPSVEKGLPLTARVTVCNEGTQPSGSSPVDVFLSTDSQLTPQDMPVGGAPVPSLEPGRCHTQDIAINSGKPEGVYTLGAIVDAMGNSVFELREDNNGAVGGALAIGRAPDYVVTTLSGPSGAQGGQPFTVPLTVCNQGTLGGPPSSVTVFLSSDAQVTPMDRSVGGVSVPPLAAGQCLPFTVQASANAPSGLNTLGAIVDAQNYVLELNEVNNVSPVRRFGVGGAPDLVLKAVSGPSVVGIGSVFATNVTVCNEGSSSVGSFPVDLVVSTDTTIDFRDERVSGVMLPVLAPGECKTQIVQGSIYNPRGPQYLGAIVDFNNFTNELFEDNNTLLGGSLLVGNAPDMVVTVLSVQPEKVVPGAPVNAQVQVCNQGNAPSTMQDVLLVQSGDERPDAKDFILGGASMPSLPPGACATLSLGGMSTGPVGTWYVGAIADPWDKMVESREDNNTSTFSPPPPPTPLDLAVTAVSPAPSYARPNTSFSTEVTACNLGTLRGKGVFVELVLSADDVYDLGDRAIGGQGLPDLEPGQCFTVAVPAVPPLAEASYRLLARVDSADGESRRDNNVLSAGTLSVSSRPVELTVKSLTSPLNVMRGPSFPVTMRVCNEGTSPTSTSVRLELFLSADTTIDRTSDLKVFETTVGLLSPGQCRDLVGVPARTTTAADGSWWLGAVVDGANVILEANEANNTLLGEQLRVGLGPDLVVASVQVPTKAVPMGTTLSTTVQVCNRGTDYVDVSSTAEVFLSSDANIGSGDYLMATRSVPALGDGDCITIPVNGSVTPVGPGTWFVGVRLDGSNAVPELREDNNLHASAQVVVGSGVNLVVTRVGGPSAARQGGPINMDADVCNQGTVSSPTVSLAFLLSGDPSIGPSDTTLTQVSVASLTAGQCRTVGASAAFGGVPEGSIFTLGAIVDPLGSVAELREDDNAKAGPRLQFDNTVPGAPSISATSPSVRGATLSPTLSGTAEAGSTVRIYTNSTCTGTVAGTGTASSTGSFTLTASALANTTTTFYARATDAAGNASPCSSGRSYTHDGIAPTAPVLTGTNPVSPGTSTQPGFQGTAEPGATVRLYTTSTCSGTVAASGTADSGGAFTLPVTVAANATTTVYASATDAVGNLSPCSTGLAYTHQDAPPSTP